LWDAITHKGLRFFIDHAIKEGQWCRWYPPKERRWFGFYYSWYDGPHYAFSLWWIAWHWESDWEMYYQVPCRLSHILRLLKVISEDQHEDFGEWLYDRYEIILETFKE
jgi:hypothetical protein